MTKLETGKSSKGASNLVSKFGKPDKKFFACDAGVPEQSKCFVKAPAVANVDIDQVKAGVGAFFKYLEKTAESKLFDEEEAIFLQVAAVKVPKCPSRQIRLSLCHSLVSDSSEVCLIVPDVGMPKEVEESTEHYKNLLRSKGIMNIKAVMPYFQFKTEHATTFETRRKLLELYDFFLVDGKISSKVAHLTGKIFMEKRKVPIPIKLDMPDLNYAIERALRKTSMKIHSHSDSFIVQVAHTKMDSGWILDNILSAVDELSYHFPGGFSNVRLLSIKTSKSLSIPLYLTLKSNSFVKVPVVYSPKPKMAMSVAGELTTQLNQRITVLASGKVVVDTDIGSDEDELTDEDGQGSVHEDVSYKTEKIKEKIGNQTQEQDAKEEESGDEEEQMLEEAEDMYLNHYDNEQDINLRSRKRKQNIPKNEGKCDDDRKRVKKP